MSAAKTVDVVIPVLNEEKDLPASIAELHSYLSRGLSDYDWKIIIADNGSTDSTPEVSRSLSADYDHVEYYRMEQRGRGRALRTIWTESRSDVVSYMDVDLSTDINRLPDLVNAITVEGYDIAIGSRLVKGANVIGRGLKREVASRGYSLMFRTMFLTGFSDAQCGFKAVSRRAADDIVPLVVDNGWFFDTELLLIAEKNGYRIKQVPVKWTEDPDSRVNIIKTAYADIKGLLRMRFGGMSNASRQLRNRLSQ